MSSSIPGTPWVEDRSSDVIEDIWAPTGAPSAARTPATGRIVQAEESGRLGRAVAEVVEAARDVVLVSSFLFADPATERALLDAARQRRVRVYLLVASEARLDKEVRADDAFGMKTVEEHKRLLDRLAGWVYVRSAEHFHAKFVIADPKSQPRGMLLTANFTREALTRNHELGIRLQPEEARALAGLFTWAFWESAQRELLEEGRLPPVTAPARVRLPDPADGIVATAGTRRDLRVAVLNLIAQAKRSLVVATFGISDPEVVDLLEERARNGVAVTLLVRHPRAAMFETLRRLARTGVEVLGVSAWLHAKAIVADGARGLVMTANLEEHGLDQGFEAGVQLAGDDAADLARVLASWRAEAPSRLRASARLGELRGTVQVMNGKGYRDLMVEVKGQLDDGIAKVDCCTRIASAQRPPQRRMPDGKLYQQVEHVWSIEPPVLAKGARPAPAPKDAQGPVPPFPVHVEPSGRRVFAIDGLGELDAARAVMAAFGVQAVVLRG
ncbi:phosphatidylserine/phosphatidylglycerophosphate/cardiolipin synthase family protein [Sorangium sp. So ce119]|uniref:phospholipase D-like domain-containing protein n=1 Tax=Sorangium sp. So ce119 TaxID=3133279 RepID=UPI003F6066F8